MTEIGAAELRAMISGAYAALKRNEEKINSLNVFPVPDGDTGTNVRLTVESMVKALAAENPDNIGDIARLVKSSSLLGARGNSGVILSQILKGVCDGIVKTNSLNCEALATALQGGKASAYKAVKQPVEGTMLTVIKDIAAKAAKKEDEDVLNMLRSLAKEAHESTGKTPELLPILAEAGVVDAGGLALAVIFEGMVVGLSGNNIEYIIDIESAINGLTITEEDYGYCTEFIMKAAGFDPVEFERRLLEFGGSVLFVSDDDIYKVHIHTDSPGKVLELATAAGSIYEISIDNLTEQSRSRLADLKSEAVVVGLIAVVAGDGIKKILGGLGVMETVDGGPTDNPSSKEILEKIDAVPYDKVIVLPNNKNVVMAAEQAAGITDKEVAVIKTTTTPQAIAAALVYDHSSDLRELRERMTKAFAKVKSLSFTRAVRDARDIKEGEWLGLIEEEIEVTGKTIGDAVRVLLKQVVTEGDEVMTVFFGSELLKQERAALEKLITEVCPHLEVESVIGGQPLYPVIISLE